MTDTTPEKPLLDLIILDCPDALALAQFYGTVLGWPLEDGSDRDWATLVAAWWSALTPGQPAADRRWPSSASATS